MSAPTVDVEAIRARAEAAIDGEFGPLAMGHDSSYGPRLTSEQAHDIVALCARVAALEAEREGLRAEARTHARRGVAAIKVIARLYHDDNGNLARAYPEGMDEIGDILAGLCDDAIAASIDAARDAGRAEGEA